MNQETANYIMQRMSKYLDIAGIFIIHLIMLIMKKTIYSRRMICFSPILLMEIFALIPDIRQALGCHLTTLDYVCSQCSGNASPFEKNFLMNQDNSTILTFW